MRLFYIKTFVMLSCIILCGVINVNAQVSSGETCIYELFKHDKPQHRFYLIKFQGTKAYVSAEKGGGCCNGYYASNIEDGFKQSGSWVENVNKNLVFIYNPQESTSARDVYTASHSGQTLYLAVSKDLSSIKYWYYFKGRVVGTWFGSGYYDEPAVGVRVDPEIFKPVSQSKNTINFLDD